MDERTFRRHLSSWHADIASVLEHPDAFARQFGLDAKAGRERCAQWQNRLKRAMLGNEDARQRIITLYAGLLGARLDAAQRATLLAPPEPDWLLLEMVLALDLLDAVLDAPDATERIGRDQLLWALKQNPARARSLLEDEARSLLLLARMLYAQENGQDVLDSLRYSSVDEIGALRRDYLYVVRRGRKVRLSGLAFPDDNALFRIQKKATSRARPPYDFNRPACTVDREGGSRISVAGHLATPGEGELYFNERLFNLRRITLEALRDAYRTIDDSIYRLLCLNQRGRGSFLVTGSEMGIGKTTFLSALIEKVPDEWGIGILDTENELRAHEHYPHKNIITVIENPHLDIDGGFRYLLKTSRDVLVVGEITRREEMESLVRGAIRLNAGIGGTLHAADARMAMRCCANLLRDGAQDRAPDEENLALSLDLIIQLGRHPHERGRIVVEEIAEVRGRRRGWESLSKEELAREELLMRLDPRPYELVPLVRYDAKTDCFLRCHEPSQAYLRKVGVRDATAVRAFLAHWRRS